jgi:hypothetical protein
VTAVLPTGSLLDLVKRGYVDAESALAIHEAGHASAALWLGLDVELATIDRDDPRVQFSAGQPLNRERVFAVMAGGIATGDPVCWRPKYGPTDAPRYSDETQLALLVDHLNFTEKDWRTSEGVTRDILSLPNVARAREAITAALYEQGSLDGDELRRLYAEGC